MSTVEISPVVAEQPVAAVPSVSMPVNQTMERVLGPLDVVSVVQTPRGCIQECMGCEARSEFKLYAGFNDTIPGIEAVVALDVAQATQADKNQIMHMLEDSPFFPDRCFYSGMRKFSIPIKVPDQDGEVMMYNEKNFSLPTRCHFRVADAEGDIPCCCYLPTLKTYTADKTYVGKTKYVCDQWLWVPKLAMYDADDKPLFWIRPDTCCFGCCPLCSGCDGSKKTLAGGIPKCVNIPYYITKHDTKEKLDGGPSVQFKDGTMKAQVQLVFSGFKRECCTSADNYFVVFPAGSSPELKAAILGATVLLDFTVYESKEGGFSCIPCLALTW